MSDATPGADKYISGQQQRLMRLIQALAGNEVEGLAPGQVGQAIGALASQVTRDLANLKAFGWAEQLPGTNRWRLGPDIVRIALRHMTALDRAERRLQETRSRFGSAGVSANASSSTHLQPSGPST